MARVDRFELMGILGFASFFLGRRKKVKLRDLADALGSAVAQYDQGRVLMRKIEDGGALTTEDREQLGMMVATMNELVEAVEAF